MGIFGGSGIQPITLFLMTAMGYKNSSYDPRLLNLLHNQMSYTPTGRRHWFSCSTMPPGTQAFSFHGHLHCLGFCLLPTGMAAASPHATFVFKEDRWGSMPDTGSPLPRSSKSYYFSAQWPDFQWLAPAFICLRGFPGYLSREACFAV